MNISQVIFNFSSGAFCINPEMRSTTISAISGAIYTGVSQLLSATFQVQNVVILRI